MSRVFGSGSDSAGRPNQGRALTGRYRPSDWYGQKWTEWGGGVPIEKLSRKEVRKFLDWVHERAVSQEGTNPGRTSNKARDHLRAIISWSWEQDLIDSLPRFPKPKPQRDVAGRHYLTKAEINALYFATHKMERPRGWKHAIPVGRYWRAALVVFFNYGVDTGTVWKSAPFHEPILWRHVTWNRQSPEREIKQQSRWGWIFYRRVKTGKTFYRPMNRVVHAHIKSVMPERPNPDDPVFHGGGSRNRSQLPSQRSSTGMTASVHAAECVSTMLCSLGGVDRSRLARDRKERFGASADANRSARAFSW